MSDDGTSKQAEAVARHLQHAQVQMFQADLAQGPDKADLITAAKDALICAERLQPGSGAWQFACISASTGNGKLCRQWLERARKYGNLPGPDILDSAPQLAKVRGQKWFRRLIKDLAAAPQDENR